MLQRCKFDSFRWPILTNRLDTIGSEIECPICKEKVTLGKVHPLIEVKKKPSFIRFKDLSDVTSMTDEYGWTSDEVLNAPTKLKRVSKPEPVDLSSDMPEQQTGQKIKLKSEHIQYNALVYNIQEEHGEYYGEVWYTNVTLNVKLLAGNTWQEIDREANYRPDWRFSRWVLCRHDWSDFMIVKLHKGNNLTGYGPSWEIYSGPHYSLKDAEDSIREIFQVGKW